MFGGFGLGLGLGLGLRVSVNYFRDSFFVLIMRTASLHVNDFRFRNNGLLKLSKNHEYR